MQPLRVHPYNLLKQCILFLQMLHNLQKTKPVCKKLCSRNLKWHLLTAHWMINISSFCSCLLTLNLKQLTLEALLDLEFFPGSFLFSTCPCAELLSFDRVYSQLLLKPKWAWRISCWSRSQTNNQPSGPSHPAARCIPPCIFIGQGRGGDKCKIGDQN